MKNRKRDRHTAKGDRDYRFAQMSSRDPGEKARERMRRPAYQSEKLSYQARLMIRKQGKQTKHLEADEYVRRRELK